ncbi:2-keto-4-pentenoate hydratase [Tianweitania sediminis]|uniref:Hydratase n=1 Tax=Tianweitania sediminis TaxID=1502156 RepID=A0A8J7R476_9HYPH|nr:hydratase [Tianweitania sediminis]MBP0437082.1 hydratase [Tianweitania sediminis]
MSKAQANRLAADLLGSLERRDQRASLSEQHPDLDLAAAYEVAASVRRLREERGERVVGRKIGFTNTTIWAEYGVAAPIWGYVYDTTLFELAELQGSFDLTRLVEPRIEPEIMFRFHRVPEAGMDERALLSCIEWVAPGFEIVQSLFPGWRFTAADTVAAFGLHGALLVGSRVAVSPNEADRWHDALARFDMELSRNGQTADRGRATNVLGGGPLAALRHLVDLLATESAAPKLQAGDIVSTGTVTRALPIAAGEQWSVELQGLPLEGPSIRFR